MAALNAFVAVVEAGGFAAGGRRLGQSRARINRQVIALEDALGVTLLNRTTRAVAPTAAGEAFYERARAILTDLEDAERAISDTRDTPAGDMRINAPMSFGTLHLGPAIADFMTVHPGIRIHLTLTDRFVDPVAEGFDITVRIGELPEQTGLIDHPIVEAKRCLCLAPDLAARLCAPAVPEALKDMPCLHYGDLPGGHIWRLIGPDRSVAVRVNGILCANNAEVLRDAAVAGLGVAMLPTFIAGPDLQAGRLMTVLPAWLPPPIYLTLLYPPNRHLSARIRAFVDFMHDRFGGRPVWDLVD